MDVFPSSKWRFVRDNDGHDYIIPADKESDFRVWVEYAESDDDGSYEGVDFSEYRIRRHISCFVIDGSIEAD